MTYPATQTFWLEPNGLAEFGLRRYSHAHTGFTCETGYHTATNIIGTVPDTRDEVSGQRTEVPRDTDHGDPRWPTHCECGYAFADEDHWQDWAESQYVRSDTGEVTTLRKAEPGACWDAYWYKSLAGFRPPDDMVLVVKCPNGHDWIVDSQSSNCTRKGEPHHCWVRHGDPRECKVTVDKNGDTCAAGGGSILAGDYHGFLISGVLSAG
jgi:hypothetical protein